MGYLLALSCALILYGTLYPFSFTAGLHEESILSLLKASVNSHVSRGDTIANVILFLPFGFFAMQRVLPRVPRFIRIVFVVAAGATFSLGIESTQSCIPGRAVSVYDLATNTVGTLLGAAFGWKEWRGKLSGFRTYKRPPAVFPVLLLGAWIGRELFPFVPTVDVQNVKNALKPLFFGELMPLNTLHHFIITMVVCRLVWALAPPGRIRTTLTFLPLGVIAINPFIIGGGISRAGITGAVLGIVVWGGILNRIPRNAGILAFLLMVQIVIQQLAPFVFNPHPGHFSVIPFIGFIRGPMLNSALKFLEKIFLYGAFVWLLVKTGLKLRFSLIISVALLTGIELMQLFIPGHVSEITDPLLAVIMGVFLYFLDLHVSED